MASIDTAALNQDSQESIKNKQRDFDMQAIKEKRELLQKRAQREKFEDLQTRRKNIDLIHCIVLVPFLIFQFLEDFMIDLEKGEIPTMSEALRAYCSAAVIPLFWLIWKHYSYRLAEMKIRKEAYHKTTLLQSSLLRPMIMECCLNALHMPPFVWISFTMTVRDQLVDYSADTFIAICSLPKLYILLRVFQNYTSWTNYRATRICQINGFTPDTFFAIKCINKSNATFFLLFIFAFSVVFFGFAVQNFER